MFILLEKSFERDSVTRIAFESGTQNVVFWPKLEGTVWLHVIRGSMNQNIIFKVLLSKYSISMKLYRRQDVA
jgi:hypothetical protein